jgi:hypothetical protein
MQLKSIGRSQALAILVMVLLSGAGSLGAQSSSPNFGVPLFPGAVPRPEAARAVEAYYAAALAPGQRLVAGIFETSAPFQEVFDFYDPHLAPGKLGWRKKNLVLQHQTETLKAFRAQIIAGPGKGRGLPVVFEPLFGDSALSQRQFESKLDRLLKQNPQAEIQLAEGGAPIPGDPQKGIVRVFVDRPYIDMQRMKLVDRTRILLITVSPGA